MVMATFTIGADARGTDGICGVVSRVVIDPVADAVTHLVVEPKHHRDAGRLVPLTLLEDGSDDIRLRCTVAEFDRLDPAEETHFVSGAEGYAGYGGGQSLMWPYYGVGGASGLGMGMWADGVGMGNEGGVGYVDQPVIVDTVPAGEVSVHRGDQVECTDGEIGHVQGLIMGADHRVSHVLLKEGHIFGRKEVAIPISAVVDVADGIRLSMTKDQVRDLPPVDIAHPDA
jgi:sporulation protein YlmC with PRC-barrel domain